MCVPARKVAGSWNVDADLKTSLKFYLPSLSFFFQQKLALKILVAYFRFRLQYATTRNIFEIVPFTT